MYVTRILISRQIIDNCLREVDSAILKICRIVKASGKACKYILTSKHVYCTKMEKINKIVNFFTAYQVIYKTY